MAEYDSYVEKPISPDTQKILLYPIAYKICCFIHEAGDKFVWLIYKDFAKKHDNIFTPDAARLAVQRMVSREILKIEDQKIPPDRKTGGHGSPVLSLCVPFESLEESSKIIRKHSVSNIDHTTPAPASLGSDNFMDSLTEALLERKTLKEQLPGLEKKITDLTEKNIQLETMLSREQKKNRELEDMISRMNTATEKREKALADLLGNKPKTVLVDETGLVQKVKY